MTDPYLDVETSAGVVRGRARGEGVAWLGVPFAAPPVNELRFRPPAPPLPWTGVRAAHRFGRAASQVGSLTSPLKPLGDGVGEDCLYLNVFAPSAPDGGSRPVLVWIHGGAYTGGSGALYDGAGLASLGDVVVVTVNYRLGVFGFVDLGAVVDPEVTSNNGLRDMVAALAWVRDNIGAFGGDPARVTMAGESAGSVAVSLLLCAPSARGLARGAVMESGSYSLIHGDDVRATVAARYATELGLTRGGRRALWALPAARLLAAQVAVDKASKGTVAAAPWFDGDVVPGSLAAAQAATRPDVALLTGSNLDESELFRKLPGDIIPTRRDVVARRLHAELGADRAQEILRRYPGDRRGERALTTDFDFGLPTLHHAERHAAAGGPTWVYRFDAGTPWFGATHAAELPYLWDWRGLSAVALRGPNTAARRSLAARMQWHWVRFVRDLDPGTECPGFTVPERATRVFAPGGDRTELDPLGGRRAAWAGVDVMPRS